MNSNPYQIDSEEDDPFADLIANLNSPVSKETNQTDSKSSKENHQDPIRPKPIHKMDSLTLEEIKKGFEKFGPEIFKMKGLYVPLEKQAEIFELQKRIESLQEKQTEMFKEIISNDFTQNPLETPLKNAPEINAFGSNSSRNDMKTKAKRDYKKKIAQKATKLISLNILNASDSTSLLKTMSAMWRDDITIRQAWDFLKTFSKRRGGAKPDLLEEEIITSPKETHEEKFLSKSPEIVEENDLIALKSVSLKENVKNAINSDQIDDIFGRKTENSAGKQIFGTKDNHNENETKTNPKEWEEYASSEGSYYSDDSSSSSDEWTFVDKAVDLKGDRREEEIKQSLYEKWSQNNDAAYDIENNLEEESRVEEENVQRTKVNATAIEKILRRELEEPKKESQEKSSEERMKCKRCTYLFDTKEENCGICGAATDYCRPTQWTCEKCGYGKNEMSAVMCDVCGFRVVEGLE